MGKRISETMLNIYAKDAEANERYQAGEITQEEYNQQVAQNMEQRKYTVNSKVMTEAQLARAIDDLDEALTLISTNKAISYLTAQPICQKLSDEINGLERILKNGQD